VGGIGGLLGIRTMFRERGIVGVGYSLEGFRIDVVYLIQSIVVSGRYDQGNINVPMCVCISVVRCAIAASRVPGITSH
jgi:hypothetical protein